MFFVLVMIVDCLLMDCDMFVLGLEMWWLRINERGKFKWYFFFFLMWVNLFVLFCFYFYFREVLLSYVGDIGCFKFYGCFFLVKIFCIRYYFLNLGGILIEEGDWGCEYGLFWIGKWSWVKVVFFDRCELYGLIFYYVVVLVIKLFDDIELWLVLLVVIVNFEFNICRIILVWIKFCWVYIVFIEFIGCIS